MKEPDKTPFGDTDLGIMLGVGFLIAAIGFCIAVIIYAAK